MPPKTYKSVQEECLKGRFGSIYDDITQISINTSSAIKLIASICYSCDANITTPQNINDADLERLLRLLLKFIQSPSDNLYETYLRSVFYILNLLVKKVMSFGVKVRLCEIFFGFRETGGLLYDSKSCFCHNSSVASLRNINFCSRISVRISTT